VQRPIWRCGRRQALSPVLPPPGAQRHSGIAMGQWASLTSAHQTKEAPTKLLAVLHHIDKLLLVLLRLAIVCGRRNKIVDVDR